MATVSSARVNKWRRQAEEYRTLADCACSDAAQDTYASLADDYDELADEFTEAAAGSTQRPGKHRSPAIVTQFWKALKACKVR